MKYRIRISQILTIILLLMARPFSTENFVIGIIIGAAGEALRIWASGNLYKDKKLATYGPYTMVRNPLYVGSFMMAIGFAIACFNLDYTVRSVALLAAVLLGFKYVYRLQVEAEETHLRGLFGKEYEDYMAQVPPYLPKLGNFGKAMETNRFSWAQAVYNRERQTITGFLAVAAFVALKMKYPCLNLF